MKFLVNKQREYFIKDLTKDFHTQDGFFKKQDLITSKPGDTIKTNKGIEFKVVKPDFYDLFKRIKRKAQIIPLKDLGVIASITGLNKNSIVLESGSGSGASCLFFSSIVKQVISFEIRKDHFDVAFSNYKFINQFLKQDNVILINDSIENINKYEKIKEFKGKIDLILLDMFDSEKVIDKINEYIKFYGFLVVYYPNIESMINFIRFMESKNDFKKIHVFEIIKREWKITNQRSRPDSKVISSGFIAIFRKINLKSDKEK